MKKCSTCGNLYAGDLCPKCVAGFAQRPTDPTQPPEELPLKPGQTFHGLEVVELLGRGGMGVVYKARQPALDRFVALKILPRRMALDPDFQSRFIREAKALGSLSHPNIVLVHDFGAEGDLFFFVMEFVDGVNLRNLLREKKLSPEQAIRIVPQLCDALEFAHAEGIVHRDIKPENILLDRKGRVKIADFGLAKLTGADSPAHMLTMTNMVMGTPHYMAPEQVENPKSVDHRADIYSMGVVFYEMLTGELPIGRFEVPSKKVQVDVRLDEVVLKALEKAPERRYQKASDVKDAVTRATSAGQTDAYSPTVVTPIPARRGLSLGARIGIAAVVLLAIVLIGNVFNWARLSEKPTLPQPPPPERVDFAKVHFGPDERPLGRASFQPKTFPRNPFPAREPGELDLLVKYMDDLKLQNVGRADVNQGYVATWYGITFLALETSIAERLEKEFLALGFHQSWTHRSGGFLAIVLSGNRDERALFADLVGRVQAKLGLPVAPPPMPVRNVLFEKDDLPTGLEMSSATVPNGTRQDFSRAGKPPALSLAVYEFPKPAAAEEFEKKLRAAPADARARRTEVHRTAQVVAQLSLLSDDVWAYEKIAGELRQWMGFPQRTFESIVPLEAELPAGYSFDKVETDVRKVFDELQLAEVKLEEVKAAFQAKLRPHGTIVLLKVEDYSLRSKIEYQLDKRGASDDGYDTVFGVEGPDDEALDALENRMREKFGWDRNSPRPARLVHARLQDADLPPGYTVQTDSVDNRSFAGKILGPGGPFPYAIRYTGNYGLIEKTKKELPYKPGDVLLVKDTVIVHVGAGEAEWPALEKIEAVLRKRLRMGPLSLEELLIPAADLPQGVRFTDRTDIGFAPNPSLLKDKPALHKEGIAAHWQAYLEPRDARVQLWQFEDPTRAAARAAAEREKAGGAAVYAKGLLVVRVDPANKSDDSLFKSLAEGYRAKLRVRP